MAENSQIQTDFLPHTDPLSLSLRTSGKEGHSYFPCRRLAHLCLHFSPYTPITIATHFLILSNYVGVFQYLFVMRRNKMPSWQHINVEAQNQKESFYIVPSLCLLA